MIEKQSKEWTIIRVLMNGQRHFWSGPETCFWSTMRSKAFRFKPQMRDLSSAEGTLTILDREPSKSNGEEYYWHYGGDPLPEHSLANRWIIVSYDPQRFNKYYYYTGTRSHPEWATGWALDKSKARSFSAIMMNTYSPEAVVEMYGGILAKNSDTEAYYWEELARNPRRVGRDDFIEWAPLVDAPKRKLDELILRSISKKVDAEFDKWFRGLTDLCAKALRNRSAFKVTAVLPYLGIIYFYCEDSELVDLLSVWGEITGNDHEDNIYRLDVSPMWRFDDIKDILSYYETGEGV